MDHELKHISFYVQKHVVSMGMCYNPALVREKPLGVPASVKRIYSDFQSSIIHNREVWQLYLCQNQIEILKKSDRRK